MADNEKELDIDLGRSPESGGMASSMPTMGKDAPEKYYPQVSIETDTDIDFPDEGEMTVRFRKRRFVEHKGSDGSKPHFQTELELTKLCEIEDLSDEEDTAEEEEQEEENTEKDIDLRADDALDKLALRKQKKG
jgi:hypothetical protein